ncbi:MAG: FAD:protein FMN transferase, partial [Planctomycetota bacterium]
MMASKGQTVAWVVLLAVILALVAVGRLTTAGEEPLLIPRGRNPANIFGGMPCSLQVAVPADRIELGNKANDRAIQAIHDVDARMSTYKDDSELSLLNTAPAGQLVPLSPETLSVLRSARELHKQTDEAFDVTVRPLIELWKDAAQRNELPTSGAIAEAREASRWQQIRLNPTGAVKQESTSRIDLGGIAKGYGVDQAVEAMQQAGAEHGLVEIGGDIRCFGHPARGGKWRVAVRNPFNRGFLAQLLLNNQAVCTSGNYERFSEIEGKRYSHIIDPRTGQPVDAAPSVTVVAPTAMTADAWATALSVLGEDGLRLLEGREGVEALLVIGTPADHRIRMTPGFGKLLAPDTPLPEAKSITTTVAVSR